MQNELVNRYLCEFESELSGLSTSEKKEIVEDIRNQIKEKQLTSNLPISIIIDSLGSPKELAESYGVKTNKFGHSYTPQNIMESFAYYGTVSRSSSHKK